MKMLAVSLFACAMMALTRAAGEYYEEIILCIKNEGILLTCLEINQVSMSYMTRHAFQILQK